MYNVNSYIIFVHRQRSQTKKTNTLSNFKVVEKDNRFALHLSTWSRERGEQWIEKYGDSKMFTDKSLTKDSFIVVENK